MIFFLPKRDCKSLWVCDRVLSKDVSQAIIGTFYQCHFQKMVG